VLLSLIYKHRALEAEGWATAAGDALLAALAGRGLVGVVGRSKGVAVVVGADHVVENGFHLADGRQLCYKHPELAFSNPNGGMAVHTLDWLSSCAREARAALTAIAEGPPPPFDLLELFCGGGNHTVAMAGVFDAVLAVEVGWQTCGIA
jgi:tRNA (uracil-5-)-methyltransferase